MWKAWKVNGFIFLVIVNAFFWIGEIKLELLQEIDVKITNRIIRKVSNFIDRLGQNKTEAKLYDCPKEPIVFSEFAFGQTGNRIWEYAGGWALAKLLKRKAYVVPSALVHLSRLFPNLSSESFERIEHCNLTFMTVKEDAEPLETLEERAKGQHLMYSRFHMLPAAILRFMDEARVEFKFNDKIMAQVNQTLKDVGAEGHVVVAVHVRRSDYPRLLKGRYHLSEANASYYLDAMDWFRKNIKGNLLFLIVCDDYQWVRENLISSEDVVIVMQDNYHDLAMLCHADHNIIDYGTFGTWGGLMTKGHTISLLRLDIDRQMAKYKNWHVFDDRKYLTRYQ
ncbi:galactoside alpha-(1,2)-fucosyltransferase 1-like [Cloeon dipterum]|uniref:galactoside alpha-(1,2)-fucosyltransferase 1-like n=1 Tax=Cloeon dipterum TaxID=197152 RepID=UPI00321FEAD3